MKELSTEQKAQRYDEAIEKLCNFYRDYDTVSCLIDVKEELANLFPEIKESEDEKIRKAIYNCVEWFGFDSCFFKDVSQEECLAWIEKQCEKGTNGNEREIPNSEQKSADKVEPKFKVGDYIERKDGLGCHAKIIFVGGNFYGCEKLIHSEGDSPFF